MLKKPGAQKVTVMYRETHFRFETVGACHFCHKTKGLFKNHFLNSPLIFIKITSILFFRTFQKENVVFIARNVLICNDTVGGVNICDFSKCRFMEF